MNLRPISVTEAAAARVKHLLDTQGKGAVGVRIGVRNAGCSGMTYTMEFADTKSGDDEVVEDKGVTILVDPTAALYLAGTEMDYVEEKLHAGFVFNNPNEKGRCGCGESFYV